jgi:hypothetical protein
MLLPQTPTRSASTRPEAARASMAAPTGCSQASGRIGRTPTSSPWPGPSMVRTASPRRTNCRAQLWYSSFTESAPLTMTTQGGGPSPASSGRCR